jgi:hypothetical protein
MCRGLALTDIWDNGSNFHFLGLCPQAVRALKTMTTRLFLSQNRLGETILSAVFVQISLPCTTFLIQILSVCGKSEKKEQAVFSLSYRDRLSRLDLPENGMV